MRYLLITLMLLCTTVCAQNVNELPLFGETLRSQQTIAADQRFIDSAVKAAGSREAAARMATFRGWQQLKQGDAEVAIQSFNQAYLLQPDNVEVFWGLGVAMTQQGKFEISVRLFERALALSPNNPRLLADIGLAHAQAAMRASQDPIEQARRLQGALFWFDAAEKLDPDYALTYANRATALYHLGRYSDAWTNIEKAESLERASVDPKLIASLASKYPRPVTAGTTTVPDTASVKTEAVTASPIVQQAAVNKEVLPKIPQGIADEPAPAVKTLEQAKREVQAANAQKTIAQASSEPSTETTTETSIVVQTLPSIPAEAAPAPTDEAPATSKKKKLRVISGQPAHPIGPDKRACLDLSTNEAIMRCVYPRK